MKKLLTLLIVMSINCKAQTAINFTMTPQNLNEKFITLTDFQAYQQECFNDSTKICYRTICDMGCIDLICDCDGKDAFMYIPSECKIKYIHKTPTFEGFLIFINKRYGK